MNKEVVFATETHDHMVTSSGHITKAHAQIMVDSLMENAVV